MNAACFFAARDAVDKIRPVNFLFKNIGYEDT